MGNGFRSSGIEAGPSKWLGHSQRIRSWASEKPAIPDGFRKLPACRAQAPTDAAGAPGLAGSRTGRRLGVAGASIRTVRAFPNRWRCTCAPQC